MTVRDILRIGGVFLAFVLLAGNGEGTDWDAESLVRQCLREKGLHVGYESGARRMVQVATVSEEIPESADTPVSLEKRRAHAFLVAETMARSSIMRSITHVMDARAGTEASSGGIGARQDTTVTSSVRTSFFPYGCELEAVEETLDAGVLEVAVALSWSPRAEKEVRRALLNGTGDGGPMSEVAEVSPEWTLWAERQDFSHTLGFRSFLDTRGCRRFVGIGTVDIEGKNGAALVAAMRVAKELAFANLAYALFGSVESCRQMQKWLGERKTDPESMDMLKTIVSEQTRKSVQTRFPNREIYQTTVVNPLTGRQLFVSVVGIEPRDFEKITLGGDGVPSVNGPSSTRPGHDSPPPTCRPDHSFRPATARPEHPWRRP